MWINRHAKRLQRASVEADQWFAQFAEPLGLRELLPTGKDCIVHAVSKNQPVSFGRILASLTSTKITRGVLQDPYLLTPHQIKCLTDFLTAIPWQTGGTKMPFRLLTHLPDANSRDRDQLSIVRQKQEIDRCLAALNVEPKVDYRSKKYAPLHMRYMYFGLEGGGERLYIFERGLDMEDPRTGKSRGDSFVLEFNEVPQTLRGILVL
jgi:hypothetical protein